MLILYAVGAIALLGVIAALAHWLRGKRYERMLRRGEISPEEIPQEVNPVDMECCGAHEVCEKDSLLAALSKQI